LNGERDGDRLVDRYARSALPWLRLGVSNWANPPTTNLCVLSEALDRLSRDQEYVAAMYKRLCHCDVSIVTLAEGKIDELHIGFKGTMNALFLKDLASKIRRGQRGRIAAGFAAGGITYGYQVVRGFDPNGDLIRGARIIPRAGSRDREADL
jgi:site-specific DNA recombinase